VNVTCQDCRSVFRVDPAKVPPNGVRARCSVCGAIVRISFGSTTPLTNAALPHPLTPLQSPASSGRATPAISEPVATSQPYPSRPTPSFSSPVWMAPAEPALSSATIEPSQVPMAMTPVSASRVDMEQAGRSATTTDPLAPLEFLPESDDETPAVAPPAVPVSTPPSATTVSVTPRPLVPPPPPSPGQLVGMLESTPAQVVASVAAPGEPRRVVNPFLRSDPITRAKRLARALVSDMVAYQPAKRAEGLANGTLKQLFRDEIRKSYDEYVDQVGREVAESTAFFQDALNEVLAEGKRVF
jgi:predicted Zn finger-like uncharacterized protein